MRYRKTGVVVLLLLIVSATGYASGNAGSSAKPSQRAERTIAAIRAVLDAQSAAWNRGDVEGYMAGYARSDKIVFISGDDVTHGWQTVLDRYKKNYNSREKMGTLTFSELEFKLFGNSTATVVGRWHLKRVSDEPHGRFTLIFKRTKQGWRITHDHTSSAS
jgi:ketosteroid isomerase-like protein